MDIAGYAAWMDIVLVHQKEESNMRKILLHYYSRRNFGDDLFVQLFYDAFKEHKIYLAGNPFYIPYGIRGKVYIPIQSWCATMVGKMQGIFRSNQYLVQILQRIYNRLMVSMENGKDACVLIGGSIFPDTSHSDRTQKRSIDFSVPPDICRDYRLSSYKRDNEKKFVIGANLGPVYRDDYFQRMEQIFATYAHVCLRDYASYYPYRENPHVQYAPDVGFLCTSTEKYTQTRNHENAVISVMDIARHTTDKDVITAYYRLLKKSIDMMQKSGTHVTLLSLCEREGDTTAVQKLLQMVESPDSIDTYVYRGNLAETLRLFNNATFVIATRFHSMIVGFAFGKPVYPIAYSCKMKHYLQDLAFEGKYATIDTLTQTKEEDILFNYKNGIICDCENHKKYASNQFEVLRKFLSE